MEDLVDEAAKKAAREAIRIFSEICATGIISGQSKVVNAEVNYSFERFMQKVVQHAQTELTEDTNFQSGPDLPQHSSLHLPDTIEPRLLHINAQCTTSVNVDVPHPHPTRQRNGKQMMLSFQATMQVGPSLGRRKNRLSRATLRPQCSSAQLVSL
jgi:hypothetical protein